MNLVPVNGHIIIEPVEHSEFMASERSTYDEVGAIVDFDANLVILLGANSTKGLIVGNKVFFDSWLAKKYPKQGGKLDEFVWLVKWEDVVAIEYVEPISK